MARATSNERPDLESQEEAEWIRAVKNGQSGSFESLMKRYQDRVYNACLRMCGNRDDASDLTQESFLRAYRAIRQFDGRARFYTWLFRIAMNVALSARRGRRTPAVSLDGLKDGPARAIQPADDGPGPDQTASNRELHACVLAAMQELEDEQRAIVILKDVESLDYQEIADVLKVPIGTVKSRLHRARLALRERLARTMGE